jgi:hypothetical protein
MKRLFEYLNTKINIKDFLISMLIFLSYFTLIAIIMLITGVWVFDMVLVYFYAGGLIISGIINIVKSIK